MCIEWKKITEKSPPAGQQVLVYIDNPEYTGAYAFECLNYGNPKYDQDPNVLYWDSSETEEISYWAELPAPPEST